MQVHHVNAATLCPRVRGLMTGEGKWFAPWTMSCHCLVIETPGGIVVVDTGLGEYDIAQPSRLGASFRTLLHPRLDAAESLAARLRALGLDRRDVRHIVLTHLDPDHAGGIADFPDAAIHVLEPEHTAAKALATMMERMRYRPAQWSHDPRWSLHPLDTAGERWFGFERVRQADGLPPEILLIPLIGHTRGHCGVAVRAGGRWLLHAGDAYYDRAEVENGGRARPALRAFARLDAADNDSRLRNLERLRELIREHADEVDVFCAHSMPELLALAAAGAPPST